MDTTKRNTKKIINVLKIAAITLVIMATIWLLMFGMFMIKEEVTIKQLKAEKLRQEIIRLEYKNFMKS